MDDGFSFGWFTRDRTGERGRENPSISCRSKNERFPVSIVFNSVFDFNWMFDEVNHLNKLFQQLCRPPAKAVTTLFRCILRTLESRHGNVAIKRRQKDYKIYSLHRPLCCHARHHKICFRATVQKAAKTEMEPQIKILRRTPSQCMCVE